MQLVFTACLDRFARPIFRPCRNPVLRLHLRREIPNVGNRTNTGCHGDKPATAFCLRLEAGEGLWSPRGFVGSWVVGHFSSDQGAALFGDFDARHELPWGLSSGDGVAHRPPRPDQLVKSQQYSATRREPPLRIGLGGRNTAGLPTYPCGIGSLRPLTPSGLS